MYCCQDTRIQDRGFQVIESKLTSNGRTTLPKAVREALAVQPGDRLRYVILDGEVRIRAVRPLRQLYGALEYDGPPASIDDMNRAIGEAALGD
jgi:AbrB family looped-hinge helix DNA binding protein